MILVDYKKGGGSADAPQLLVEQITRLGVTAEKTDLQYGDLAFEGQGPEGTIAVGIERKTLHDMLNCIDDARFSGHQRLGMKQLYTPSILMVEGHWKPHDPHGILMEGFNGGTTWGFCRYRSQRTAYSKLYRYLLSVSLSGVIVTYSRDLFHTAFNTVELYHYFQKPWHQHTAMREMHRIAIPTLNRKPSLVRRWAAAVDGVGLELSERAEGVFKTPIKLATADEMQWLRIPGLGVRSAKQIVRDIWGGG